MITLKISPTNANEYSDLILKSKGRYISVLDKLEDRIASTPLDSNIEIFNYLFDKINLLLTGSPHQLEKIITEFKENGFQNRIYNSELDALSDLGKEIENIFNYKSFRKSKKAIWFAKASKIKSCVICNTQYTLITNQERGEKLLSHIDHYYPQSKYPYLSLSYYNLLICCPSCNLSKSNKPFSLDNFIHPYTESFHEIAKFNLDNSGTVEFLLNPSLNQDSIRFSIDIRPKYYGNSVYEEKLKNYLKIFRINEQYLQFKDLAGEMILKSQYYNKSRRKEIVELFKEKSINMTDESITRFIIGNYTLEKDLLKRPLAKFTKDIAEDLKLI